MKTVKAVLIVAVLIIVQAYAFSAYADGGYMRLSYLEGDAQIMTPEAGQWGLLSINTPIAEGDQIWVPQDGIAELQLNSGSYIRLDGNTSLQILSMDEDSSQFYLSQGSAYVYYDAPQGSVIQVDDPDASTRAFDRAIFRVDVQNQYSDVSCYKGYVETENQLGNTRVNAGQAVSLGRDTNGDIGPIGQPDEWDLWNRGRNDELFSRRDTGEGAYLPSELSPYSSELDRSGRWVRVPDYGYVWSPTVFVGPNWAPYRHGRWIRRGHDYVWLSNEPWGWAPYHYGRWAFAPAVGWFWVPPHHGSVHWGPGYVGWARTADYVAWVPLAPGETYYGRGDYGRNSVNITHVNIKQVNVTKVYQNVYINNGATVVRHDRFDRGFRDDDHVDMKIIKEKIFVKNHMSPGTPDIKPTKESYFVSDRRIPPDKAPPPRIRDVRVKELQQDRKFIRERDKSVLHPGKAPKALPLTAVSTPRSPGKQKNTFPQFRPEGQPQPAAPDNGRGRKEERKQPQVEPQQGQPAAPDNGRGRKEEKKQVQVEQQGQPAAPDNGRGRKEERKQPQVEPQGQPTAPDNGRGRKEERKQIQVEQQGQPAAPDNGQGRKEERKPVQVEPQLQPVVPDSGRGRKVEKPPAQVEPQQQLSVPDTGRAKREERKQQQVEPQRQPAVPDSNRGRKVERPPAQVEPQRQLSVPDTGRAKREERKPQQVEPQRQPAVPDSNRVRQVERPPAQVEPQRQLSVPDTGRAKREDRKQQQVEPQRQPAVPDSNRVRQVERPPAQVEPQRQLSVPDAGRARREERKQQQVEPQRQPAGNDGDRAAKGKRKPSQEEQGQSGSPQCGPGQKDEFNPAKCPQRRR
ncbi:MAG: FecR domain-containing protein [Desulfobulbaceae bacterium]|nr:FecR domain-containing protein [Desulfobulbaceae bacterium]